jgi:uncharacterized damage-inducible protein DinB
MTEAATDPRYPIGKLQPPADFTPDTRRAMIAQIAEAPERLRDALRDLGPEQLRTPYRPGGWTVAQVVHHLADSHMNAYVRFKLALTEGTPTIKPYKEERWAELADASSTEIEPSIRLIEGLHARWVAMLRTLTLEDWARTFLHPEQGREVSLDRNLAIYSWHGRHHVAHITELRRRMGW